MSVYVKNKDTYIALLKGKLKKMLKKMLKKCKKLVDKAGGYMYNNPCAGQIAQNKIGEISKWS